MCVVLVATAGFPVRRDVCTRRYSLGGEKFAYFFYRVVISSWCERERIFVSEGSKLCEQTKKLKRSRLLTVKCVYVRKL